MLLGIGTLIDRDRNAGVSNLGATLQDGGQEPASSGDNAVSDNDTASDDAAVSGENAAQLALDPFSNVTLSVIAADVRFEEGEAYGLRYQLHPDELVIQAEVGWGDPLFLHPGKGGRLSLPGTGRWW